MFQKLLCELWSENQFTAIISSSARHIGIHRDIFFTRLGETTLSVQSRQINETQRKHLPYLTCAISPTTMSATGSWMTWLPRTTWNFCSCSIRLCRPLNCFSLLQSLKAVTSTTQTTESRMAAPSIQPASDSPSSSTPPAAAPHAVWTHKGGGHHRCGPICPVFPPCSGKLS